MKRVLIKMEKGGHELSDLIQRKGLPETIQNGQVYGVGAKLFPMGLEDGENIHITTAP